MKIIMTFILLALSSLVQAQECYHAENNVPSNSNLPSMICLSSYNLELIVPTLPSLPFYFASMETPDFSVGQRAVFLGEEAPFKVSVSKSFKNYSAGNCDTYYNSKIVVNFKVDEKGKKIPALAEVYAQTTSIYDTCHSEPVVDIIKFKKL